jgi:hypothetical protein
MYLYITQIIILYYAAALNQEVRLYTAHYNVLYNKWLLGFTTFEWWLLITAAVCPHIALVWNNLLKFEIWRKHFFNVEFGMKYCLMCNIFCDSWLFAFLTYKMAIQINGWIDK